jgi:hypothetical protein
MFPIASVNTRGSAFHEGVMRSALLTIALALFASCGTVLMRVSENWTKRSR